MELLHKVFHGFQMFAESSILDTLQLPLKFKIVQPISMIIFTLTIILLFAPVMRSQIHQIFFHYNQVFD